VFLENWVEIVQQQYPLELTSETNVPELLEVVNRLDTFWAPEVMRALRDLNDFWNQDNHHSASLYSATRGLVTLSVQALDDTETADRLYAKALAFLAMTKVLTGYTCVREESLLAYTMGYSEPAQTLAQELHESDMVRVYVNHDDARLETVVNQQGVNPESKYFLLMRRAILGGEMGDVLPFVNWVTDAFPNRWLSLPILKTSLDLKVFSNNPALREGLPWLIVANVIQDSALQTNADASEGAGLRDTLRQLLTDGGERYEENGLRNTIEGIQQALNADAAQAQAEGNASVVLANRFDAEVESLCAKCTGPFLDSQVCDAYYRGYFYSAMYHAGLHYLNTLAPTGAEQAYGELLGKATGRSGAAFRRWYRAMAASQAGRISSEALSDTLARQGDLGAPVVLRAFGQQKSHFSYGDPELLDVVTYIVPRLDTRITHRAKLGDYAYTDLYDLKLTETLYQSVVKADPARYHNLRVWLANFTGDEGMLRQLLSSPTLKPQAKARILGYLEKLPDADPALIEDYYQRLIQENLDSLTMCYNYANYLERQGRYAEGRLVLEEWLTRRESPGQDSETVFAHSKIAWLYYREGLYEEGWHVIEPVVQTTWQAGVMERAAELLDKRGLAERAEEMGEAAASRYRDSVRTRALLAGLYWKHGKYDDAAMLLNSAPRKISTSDWRYVIAPRFADAFVNKPEEGASSVGETAPKEGDALKAFSALQSEGIGPFELEGLLFSVEENKDYKLAFEMLSQLQSPGAGENEFTIRAYKNLSQWKGQEEALAWLRGALPADQFAAASMAIYEQGEYGLLWDLIQEVPRGERGDFIWLMRAAAVLRTDGTEDPHYSELLEYFKSATNVEKRPYIMIGRFLLDLVSEDDVLALADSPQRICEVAYYIGLREQLAGRYGDASDWYRIAVKTGQRECGEYRWAYDTLYVWQTEGKSLNLLEAETI